MRRLLISLSVLVLACGSPAREPELAAPELAAPELAAPFRAAEIAPAPVESPFGGTTEAAVTDRRLVVGDGFTCVLDADRRVRCWGQHPGTAQPTAPTMLDELDGAIELVGDAEHVCARDGLGRVRCAANPIGSRLRLATEGVAIEGATSIGVGGALLCARLPEGTVRCEGLGDEQTRVASAIDDALQIFSVLERVCVARREHPAVCFHAASDSTLEVEASTGVARFGDIGSMPCPLGAPEGPACRGPRFEPPTDAVALVGEGARYCALRASGEAQCLLVSGAFQPVPGAAIAVAARRDHACVLFVDGSVACSGENQRGEVTGEVPPPAGRATRVRGVEGAVALALDGGRACVLDASGALRCWSPTSTEAELIAAPRLTSIAGSRTQVCAVTDGGAVLCFRQGVLRPLRGIRTRELSDGYAGTLVATTRDGRPALLDTFEDDPALFPLPALAGATDLHVAGGRVLCGVRDGAIACAAVEGEPPSLPALAGVTRYLGDPSHHLVLTASGPIYWGDAGALPPGPSALGRPAAVREPTPAPSLEGVAALAINGIVTRLDRDGTVRWHVTGEWVPIEGLEGAAREIADGCALMADGTVQCWGATVRGDGIPRVVAGWATLSPR